MTPHYQTGIMAGTKAQAELFAKKNRIADYVFIDNPDDFIGKHLRCVYLVGSFYFNKECSNIISTCHHQNIPYYEDKSSRIPTL
jgi:hypothetical protein